MGLKAVIWALRLGSESEGRGMKEKKEEKIPHMCESIGHRPLRGRCPKSVKGLIELALSGLGGVNDIQ